MSSNKKIFVAPIIYILFILIPIYWLLIMSFKTNAEIGGSITLYPHQPTLDNYLFSAIRVGIWVTLTPSFMY